MLFLESNRKRAKMPSFEALFINSSSVLEIVNETICKADFQRDLKMTRPSCRTLTLRIEVKRLTYYKLPRDATISQKNNRKLEAKKCNCLGFLLCDQKRAERHFWYLCKLTCLIVLLPKVDQNSASVSTNYYHFIHPKTETVDRLR